MMDDRENAPAVRTAGLRKVYRSRQGPPKEALKSVDLEIQRGSVFGLLGPNGAGKSTLINILAGLVIKTSGRAWIQGWDIEENMREARCSMALDDKADTYARNLSGGMRRRLLVAKALVHSPPVVVLDEPTAGVDVELRQALWDYMKELNDAGTTILLTTHYLEEAQEMCDRIAIINHGEIVAEDTTAALLSRLDRKEALITVDRDIDAVPPGLAGSGVDAELQGSRAILIRFPPSRRQIGALLDTVKAAGYDIVDMSTRDTDLEEIFVALTSGSEGAPAHHPADRQAASIRRTPPLS